MDNIKKKEYQEINLGSRSARTAEQIVDEHEDGVSEIVIQKSTYIESENDIKNYIIDDYTDDELKVNNVRTNIQDNAVRLSSEKKMEYYEKPPAKSGSLDVSNVISIDLSEAEAIASEDIRFLSENDLVEALEDYNLVELKNEDQPQKKSEKPDHVEQQKKTDIEISVKQLNPKKNDLVSEEENEPIKIEPGKNEKERVDAIIKIIEEQNENKPVFEERISPEKDTEQLSTKIIDYTADEIIEKSIEASGETRNKPPISIIEEDIIPPEIAEIEKFYENVLFTDDRSTASRIERIRKSDYDLNRISHDLDDNIEGKGIVFTEADIESDRDLRPDIYTATAAFDDLLFDFEDIAYKYRDDELGFIDSAIIQDDYSQYIKEIDEFYDIESQVTVSRATELFKLTPDEFQQIEVVLFSDEYKGIDLSEMFDLVKSSDSNFGNRQSGKVKVNYIVPDFDSFSMELINSIEEDLSGRNAIIYEEDVEVIKKLFNKPVSISIRENLDQEIKVLSETDLRSEDIAKTDEEQITDITSQIVILEDSLDVDRFIKTVPDKKQQELKKLLKYLDGLFEKLPENAIKTFVNSEYFDLYVKILNEIGD